MTKVLHTGAAAPHFELLNQDNEKISLKALAGQWVLLYFYPKDKTPGCTIEAQDFTKLLPEFKKRHTVVLGLSPDSTKSHCSFIKKEALQLTLLSDPKHETIAAYGQWQLKKTFGFEHMGVVRSTFIIDPQGKLAHVWLKVTVPGHAAEVLETLKDLQTTTV